MLTSEQVKHYRLWLSGALEIEWRNGSRTWYAPGAWTKLEGGQEIPEDAEEYHEYLDAPEGGIAFQVRVE